jgi:hypothetical protein
MNRPMDGKLRWAYRAYLACALVVLLFQMWMWTDGPDVMMFLPWFALPVIACAAFGIALTILVRSSAPLRALAGLTVALGVLQALQYAGVPGEAMNWAARAYAVSVVAIVAHYRYGWWASGAARKPFGE